MSRVPSLVGIEGMKKLNLSSTDNEERDDGEATRKITCWRGYDSNVFDPVERIRKGFLYFKINKFERFPDYYDELAEDQAPKFLVFSCSDSRVSASNILNFQPGEAFMIRNIANMVPPFDQAKHSETGAVIEYAMLMLKVKNILIVGHSHCGGIKRLMEHPENDEPPFNFIDEWVKIGSAAKTKVQSEFSHLPNEKQHEICEKEAVNISLANLLTYPYVRSALAKNAVKLRGAHYDFDEGSFELWEFQNSSDNSYCHTVKVSNNNIC